MVDARRATPWWQESAGPARSQAGEDVSVMPSVEAVLPIFLFILCVLGLAGALLVLGNVVGPRRPSRVKQMPYESGMDPIHDTRRRFDVRFHLVAIAFLVFDVELLFLYPWAVVFHAAAPPRREPAAVAGPAAGESAVAGQTAAPERVPTDGGAATAARSPEATAPTPQVFGSSPTLFWGGMVFLALLAVGFVYDWRKGVFEWR